MEESGEGLSRFQMEIIHKRLSNIIYSQIQNLEPSRQDVQELLKFNPSQITDAVFAHPPEVRGLKPGILDISEPDEIDQQYASQEITPPKKLNESEIKQITLAVTSLQEFLGSNLIKDEFTSHRDQRLVWESSIRDALSFLDRTKGTRLKAAGDIEAYKRNSYASNFKTRWDNNKYSTNRITKVLDSVNRILLTFEGKLDKSSQEKLVQLKVDFWKILNQERFTHVVPKMVGADSAMVASGAHMIGQEEEHEWDSVVRDNASNSAVKKFSKIARDTLDFLSEFNV